MKKILKIYFLCLLTACTVGLSNGYGQSPGDSLYWYTDSEVRVIAEYQQRYDNVIEEIESLQGRIIIKDSLINQDINIMSGLYEQNANLQRLSLLQNREIDIVVEQMDNYRDMFKKQRRQKILFAGTTILAVALGLIFGN